MPVVRRGHLHFCIFYVLYTVKKKKLKTKKLKKKTVKALPAKFPNRCSKITVNNDKTTVKMN